jgi:hypothetical protein
MRGGWQPASLCRMRVSFQPTQLESAIHAPLLKRAVKELFPPQTAGEIALVRRYSDEPMRLVFRMTSCEPIAVEFDRQMLYSDGNEEQLFDRVRELRDRHLTAGANRTAG